jgi:protein-disulfide isomerase
MEDPKYEAAAKAEAAEGADLGVTSTPTLFINGEILRGVPTWEELTQRIEAAASGEGAAGGSPAPSAAAAAG